MWNGTATVSELSHSDKPTACSTAPLSMAMSEHSPVTGTPQRIREWLMLSPAASPASHSASQASAPEPTMSATCGPPLSSASAQYDPASRIWKTCRVSFLADISELFSATWPRAGMTCAGVFYQQPKWERRINVIGSGLWPTPRTGKTTDEKEESWLKRKAAGKVATPPLSLAVRMWATPSATDGQRGGKITNNMTGILLAQQVNTPERWPTPTADDANNATRQSGDFQSLTRSVGGALNPDWVEWLMGWPIGLTDLRPLAMESFQQWRRLHGIC